MILSIPILIVAGVYPTSFPGSLSSASLVVGEETLVAAGHMTTLTFKTAGRVGALTNFVERTIKYYLGEGEVEQL